METVIEKLDTTDRFPLGMLSAYYYSFEDKREDVVDSNPHTRTEETHTDEAANIILWCW